MTVKSTQVTEIYSGWTDKLDSEDIESLNGDLESMGSNIKVLYEATPDGWTIKFIKET